MSYLCGGDYTDFLDHGARHLMPTIAPERCASGTVSLNGACTTHVLPSDLPRALNPQQQSLSASRLGPILGDRLVPAFSVSLSHAISPEFKYLEALRLENGNFRILLWNALSLDANCCKLYNPHLTCIYGQEVSPADLQAIITLLYQINTNMRNAPLQICFRSKRGLYYEADLTA